ncbi:MAG: hypothetical protein WCR37_04900, partial [Candidatus Methanomethylophilaceae archaeon]
MGLPPIACTACSAAFLELVAPGTAGAKNMVKNLTAIAPAMVMAYGHRPMGPWRRILRPRRAP